MQRDPHAMFSFVQKIFSFLKARCCFYICLIGMVLLAPKAVSSDEETKFLKHEVQFAILLQIVNFIEWPETISDNAAPLCIGVYVDDDVRQSLDDLLKESSLSESIQLYDIRPGEDTSRLETMDIIYFGDEKDAFTKRVLSEFQRNPIVFVGSQKGFLKQGGSVNFIERKDRIAFEINSRKSEKTGVTFRAKLLRLAENVVH